MSENLDCMFDYDHQAWVKDGVYVRCGHPGVACECYGRLHAGEPVASDNLWYAEHVKNWNVPHYPA